MTGAHAELCLHEPLHQRLEAFIRLVDRELGLRQRVYPRQVAKNLMTQDLADAQIRGMAELRDYLQEQLIAARKAAGR